MAENAEVAGFVLKGRRASMVECARREGVAARPTPTRNPYFDRCFTESCIRLRLLCRQWKYQHAVTVWQQELRVFRIMWAAFFIALSREKAECGWRGIQACVALYSMLVDRCACTDVTKSVVRVLLRTPVFFIFFSFGIALSPTTPHLHGR